MQGIFQILPTPDPARLSALTRTVVRKKLNKQVPPGLPVRLFCRVVLPPRGMSRSMGSCCSLSTARAEMRRRSAYWGPPSGSPIRPLT